MTRSAARRLIAITAVAWLSTPLSAADIIELRTSDSEKRGQAVADKATTGTETRAPDALIPASRLKSETASPDTSTTKQHGNDMKHIREAFLATTRSHWINTDESES